MLKIMARATTVAAGFALLCTVFFTGTSQAAQQPAPRGSAGTAQKSGQVTNAPKITNTAAAQPDETRAIAVGGLSILLIVGLGGGVLWVTFSDRNRHPFG